MRYKKGPTTKDRLYSILLSTRRLGIYIPKDIRKILYNEIDELNYEVWVSKRVEHRYFEPIRIETYWSSLSAPYRVKYINGRRVPIFYKGCSVKYTEQIATAIQKIPSDIKVGPGVQVEYKGCWKCGLTSWKAYVNIYGVEINKITKKKKLLARFGCNDCSRDILQMG